MGRPTAQEWMTRAKSLFRKGTPNGAALKVLSTGIIATEYNNVDLLDMRAAILDLNGKLDLAVKDAKLAIKADKTDSRGYLRLGKLLQKQENFETAYQIYKHCLRNVSPAHPNYPIAETAYKSLRTRLGIEDVKVDPATLLPYELLDQIFSQVSFRTKIRCLRVSKTWRRFLESDHLLWRTIDMGCASAPHKSLPTCLNKSLQRAKQPPRTIKFGPIMDSTVMNNMIRYITSFPIKQWSSELSFLLPNASQWIFNPQTMLQITESLGANIQILSIHTPLTYPNMIAILASVQTSIREFKHSEIHEGKGVVLSGPTGRQVLLPDIALPNLERYTILPPQSGASSGALIIFPLISRSGTNVEALDLGHSSHMWDRSIEDDTMVDISNSPDLSICTRLRELNMWTRDIPILPQSIEFLRLSNLIAATPLFGEDADNAPLLKHLQHLEFINSVVSLPGLLSILDGSTRWNDLPGTIDATMLGTQSLNVDFDEQVNIHLGAIRLKSFRLAFTQRILNPDFSPRSVLSLIRLRPIFQGVSHLDLTGCPVNDDIVSVICRTFEKLVVVILYDTDVTGVSVRLLANRYGTLKTSQSQKSASNNPSQAPPVQSQSSSESRLPDHRTRRVLRLMDQATASTLVPAPSSQTLTFLGLLNCRECGPDAIQWARKSYTFDINWSAIYSGPTVERLVKQAVWIPSQVSSSAAASVRGATSVVRGALDW